MRSVIAILALLSVTLGTGAVCADTLIIDNARQAEGRPLPARGLLKSEVEHQYGAPRERLPAVGQPPISRWIYDGYTVYFEYDHVVHAVHHHRRSP